LCAMSEHLPNRQMVGRYLAQRAERELRDRRRERRRARRLYALGLVMLWILTVVLAFGLGYSQDHTITQSAGLAGGTIICLLIGGAILMGSNEEGEKVWIEDPEAADRWRKDLDREKSRR
jgi:multisubunit Na+/H+ antiporter MnhB subunit